MPRPCSTCSSPQVNAIDAALREGASAAIVSRDHGVSRDSVARHWRNGHASSGKVVPMAAPGSLMSNDLLVRSHAVLAAFDAAIRRAERSGSTLARLKLLRGKRRALAQRIRASQSAVHDVVTDAQRDELEDDWRRTVDAYQGADTPTALLMALEGLGQSLAALLRASPPPGAKLISVAISAGGRTTVGEPFYTSNAAVIAAAESGRPIKLEIPAPARSGSNDG